MSKSPFWKETNWSAALMPKDESKAMLTKKIFLFLFSFILCNVYRCL